MDHFESWGRNLSNGTMWSGSASFYYKNTLPETNMTPENTPGPKRKVIFQPSIFRGYVSFREGIL